MIEGLVGALVWVAANGAYRNYVREGERGFKRVAAFVLGFPITLVSAFLVRPGRRGNRLQQEEDEDRALLLEIRRDTALREGIGEGLREELQEGSRLHEEGPAPRE